MNNLPKNIIAVNFAARIFDNLKPPRVLQRKATIDQIRDNSGIFIVSGNLNLSHANIKTEAMARCEFHVGTLWPKNIPKVFSLEPWKATPNDKWHVLSDVSLCVEFPPYWRDQVALRMQQKGLLAATEFAAHWLLNSTRTLLYRHLLRAQGFITDWPPEWEYWPHDEAGIQSYFDRTRGARVS